MFNEEWKREFLSREGWLSAVESRAGEDWALRRFSRLTQSDGKTAILMESLLDSDPRATLGHKLVDYMRIAAFLNAKNFPAPEIYAEDVAHGLMLIEDFGDRSLHEIFESHDEDLKSHYIRATDLLLRFYHEIDPSQLDLPQYRDTAIYKGRQRIIDWYYPAVMGRTVEGGLRQNYLDIWDDIESRLPMPVIKFSHADYHPHNLMIRTNGPIGLIDFQGAMWAPAPYDLVNLLEDVRRTVPDDIRAECLAHFLQNIPSGERESFSRWYDALACQFHCRVIGQAIRLAVRDGKARLLAFVPNIESYLQRDMTRPGLEPLREFFDKTGLRFDGAPLNLSPYLFAADAF